MPRRRDDQSPRRTKAEIEAELAAERTRREREARVYRERAAERMRLVRRQQLLAEAEEARRAGDLGTAVQKLREANET